MNDRELWQNNPETLDIIGKDEMNLIEFPISLLSSKEPSGVKTLEFSDTSVEKNGKTIEKKWVVTGSDKFGLPLVYDNDVLMALFYIGRINNFSTPKIFFSRYELFKIMNWRKRGRNYKRIEAALNRLSGVRIYAKNAFWDNEKKKHITINFGILDTFVLFGSGDKTEKSCVVLNSFLHHSIKSGYIKNLDIKLYFSFNGVITRRLYRYLDKKRYGKTKFEINLFNLAKNHIGLSKCDYPSQIKEKLDPAHGELIKKGFLKSVKYKETANGNSEKVVYIFTDKKKAKQPRQVNTCNHPALPPPPEPENEILKTLIGMGVTEKVALGLVSDYPESHLKEQIEVLPYRGAKDPAALLVRSIKDNWASPAEYKKDFELKKRTAVRKTKKEKEERRKAEQRQKIEDYLAGLLPDELAEMNKEARDRAMHDGGEFIRKFGVPDGMLNAYVFVLAEEKLEINNTDR